MRIAIRPAMRSLNVGVAAALALGEAMRQIGANRRSDRMTHLTLLARQEAAPAPGSKSLQLEDYRHSREAWRTRRPARSRRTPRRLAGSSSSPGRASIIPARRAEAGAWRCSPGASSRKRASMFRKVHRNFRAGIRQPDPGRGGGSAFLGGGDFADRPSPQSECPDRSYEHAFRRRRPSNGSAAARI